MKFIVSFTVDVDWDDGHTVLVKQGDPLCTRLEESVAEAITNAVAVETLNRFHHDMEDLVSILFDSEVRATFVE